jgi:hypothetical protein
VAFVLYGFRPFLGGAFDLKDFTNGLFFNVLVVMGCLSCTRSHSTLNQFIIELISFVKNFVGSTCKG